MSKPLSRAQLDYLRYIGGALAVPCMSPRGLVGRGCLSYRWGSDPSFGYRLTPKGRRLLEESQ
jgi:hypothetical protein